MADKSLEQRRNQGGRPRSSEPGTTVCTWLRSSEHDKLIRKANQQDISVSEVIRRLIREQA